MRPPGRSSSGRSSPLLLSLLIILFLINTQQHHVTTQAATTNVINAVNSSTTLKSTALITTTTTTTHATIAITHSNTTKSSAAPTPTPSTPPLPRHCKNCPLNNNLGLICFKNTQCVPVSLLCNTTSNTTAINPCMDATGAATASDPIDCIDQLCYPRNFLPLPSPGTGTIPSNSSINCAAGKYFSLFGTSGQTGAMRYTQSCVFEATLPTNSTKTVCKDWEYLGQNSCFLKTCGPGLDCEPPWVCRRSNFTGTEAPYGLCMSANSTVDPSDDGDGDSSTPHDRLIVGILVGVCSLVLGVGVGTGICHYRKRRMRQMAVRSLDPNANSLNQKSSTLRTYFDACCCCFYGANMGLQGNNMDIDNSQDDDVRGPRVLSVTESDQGTENSLISSHRSNLVFARRWRWGAGRHAGEDTSGGRMGVTSGGVAVLPEFEPPPLYNQGPDLPTYRDRNSIMLTSVSRPHSVGDQIPLENIETGDQPTSPTSISKHRNEEL